MHWACVLVYRRIEQSKLQTQHPERHLMASSSVSLSVFLFVVVSLALLSLTGEIICCFLFSSWKGVSKLLGTFLSSSKMSLSGHFIKTIYGVYKPSWSSERNCMCGDKSTREWRNSLRQLKFPICFHTFKSKRSLSSWQTHSQWYLSLISLITDR